MYKDSQSSIWDNLIKIMPEFKEKIIKSPDYIDPTIARSLYNIWRTGSQDDKNKIFKKPVALGQEEINRIKDSGLIQAIGDNLQITDKGQKIIRIMILGDDRSVFEDDGLIVEYNKALDKTKGVKVAKIHKIASGWWDRFVK
jgi:hypothetical protein